MFVCIYLCMLENLSILFRSLVIFLGSRSPLHKSQLCQELVDFAKDKEKGYVGMPQKNGRNVKCLAIIPIPSMYGIFTYIWWIFMVNVGKYIIHGCYGICIL